MVYLQLEKTDFEVLSFLIENLNKEFSIRELAGEIKKPYVKVHSSIKRLADRKIIKEDVKGKSHYCSIDYKNNIDVICFINYQKAKEFLQKNKRIKILVDDITMYMKTPNYTLILFGSYSKRNADKHSDVDIAIITSREDKEKAERVMNSVKRLSSLDIHFLEFTYKNFIDMLKSKEMNVGREMTKNHIIFNGCEQFYNCMRLAE